MHLNNSFANLLTNTKKIRKNIFPGRKSLDTPHLLRFAVNDILARELEKEMIGDEGLTDEGNTN